MDRLTSSKSIVLFAASALLVVAWIALVFVPGRSATVNYALESAALETDLQQLHSLFLSAGQSAQQHQDVRSRTSEALSAIMPEDSLEQFIDKISAILKTEGLHEITIAPLVEAVLSSRKVIVGNQELSEVLLQTTLVGRYLDIGKALDYLEQQPYFSEYRLVNLAYDDDLNPAIVCQFDLTVYLRAKGSVR